MCPGVWGVGAPHSIEERTVAFIESRNIPNYEKYVVSFEPQKKGLGLIRIEIVSPLKEKSLEKLYLRKILVQMTISSLQELERLFARFFAQIPNMDSVLVKLQKNLIRASSELAAIESQIQIFSDQRVSARSETRTDSASSIESEFENVFDQNSFDSRIGRRR